MNPTRKVPTIADGDLTIWESHTILRYLATQAKSPLYPLDPAARSHVERWMDWGLAALNSVYLGGFKDAKKAAAERAADTVPNLIAELKILEGQLARSEWCAGTSFSLADIALGPIVRRCMAFPYELPAMPHISKWVERLEGRAAFMTAIKAG
jgi:glutathione S-transferase